MAELKSQGGYKRGRHRPETTEHPPKDKPSARADNWLPGTIAQNAWTGIPSHIPPEVERFLQRGKPDPNEVLEWPPPDRENIHDLEIWHWWQWWALYQKARKGEMTMAGVVAHGKMADMMYQEPVQPKTLRAEPAQVIEPPRPSADDANKPSILEKLKGRVYRKKEEQPPPPESGQPVA